MPTTCCILDCGSRGDRDGALYKFYKIPGELNFPHKTSLNELSKKRRQKWINAINRIDITDKTLQYAKVCSKHFVSGKPSALTDTDDIDWVPSLALGYGTINSEDTKKMAYEIQERASKRRLVVDNQVPSTSRTVTVEELLGSEASNYHEVQRNEEKQCQTNVSLGDFTSMVVELESMKELKAKVEKLKIGYTFFEKNDGKTKYYTGINSFQKLDLIFKRLQPYIVLHHNTRLGAYEQVILTLMKLRLNLDFKDLAYCFDISPTTASIYFRNTIEIMYERFKKLIMWPSRDIIRLSMPECFKESFGDNISVIVDCFEIFIEKPSDLLHSAQCWSNYKHHHTLKYLIGITPQGSICFISEAWGGRTSDKYITINSKFLDKINPGDVVMADRGFLIEDHIQFLNASIQMPVFTKGKKQMEPLELERTRAIAHVRIHVECIIEMIRQKFRILNDTMPISLIAQGDTYPIIDKIVVVCSALINLCPPIIPLTDQSPNE